MKDVRSDHPVNRILEVGELVGLHHAQSVSPRLGTHGCTHVATDEANL
jgi:hypothetical protein